MIRLAAGREGELPCVWVLAGILSHRPCHRHYECDGCDLYEALRGKDTDEERTSREPSGSETARAPGDPPRSERGTSAISAYLAELNRDCILHLDRPYTESHLWIDVTEPTALVVGLDHQALRVLYPLDDIVLPRTGVWLERGEVMGWMVRGHRALSLRAPVSGEVLETNDSLPWATEDSTEPPGGDPWLLRLRPHEELEKVDGLLWGEEMLVWHRDRLATLREYLRAAMALAADAGPTLNDGGAINRNLEEVLGTKAFRALLDHLFRSGP